MSKQSKCLSITEAELRRLVEDRLPEMKRLIEAKGGGVVMHQDAFAADYQIEEFILLGMCIKYIGLSGKVITIGGKNYETCDGSHSVRLEKEK